MPPLPGLQRHDGPYRKSLRRACYGFVRYNRIQNFSRRSGEEHTIDLKAPWKRMSMEAALRTYANIDVSQLSETEMRHHLIEKAKFDPKRSAMLLVAS